MAENTLQLYPVRHWRKKCGRVAGYLIAPFGQGGRLPGTCASCGRPLKIGDLDLAAAMAPAKPQQVPALRRVRHFHAKGSIVTEAITYEPVEETR